MTKKSPPVFMTEREIVKIARTLISYDVTQGELARSAKVSQSYLSGVLSGKKGIGPALLTAFGFDPQPYYKKIKD